MLFSRENARSYRSRFGGRRRAEYWRSIGFPNLVRAREAKARKRADRLGAEESIGAIAGDADSQSDAPKKKPKKKKT